MVFQICTSLTSIIIPNTVTSISVFAFQGCTSLTSINIPAGFIIFDTSSFEGCTSLTSIIIPDSVVTIGSSVFLNCNSLYTVVIDNPSNISTVSTNSFTNVSSVPISKITFYLTNSFNDLSSTWKTISTYYRTVITSPEPTCFNEGTKILCLNKYLDEEYIPVEKLEKGVFVKTYNHGYRKIDLIGKNTMKNNPNKFTDCMYKMKKTPENELVEDLIITGGHSILVDDLLEYKEENDEKFYGRTPKIDNKYLLLAAVSRDFIKLEDTNIYTYYHFTLENDGDDDERFGVWANGILADTPSKNDFLKNNYILL